MNEIAEELPVEGTAPDLSVVSRLRKVCAGMSVNTHTLRDQVCEVVHQLADEMEALIASAHDVRAVRMPAIEALVEHLQHVPALVEQMQIQVNQVADQVAQLQQAIAPPPVEEEVTSP